MAATASGRLYPCRISPGRPAAQSNDVFVDDRGLIYLTDRWGGGLDILALDRTA